MQLFLEGRDAVPLVRSANALHRIIDERAVILHAETGDYFTLNAVGSRVWELLETPTTPTALRTRMLGEFDVAPDALARDIDAFLRELEGAGLVRPVT
jgi:hypothetical protein